MATFTRKGNVITIHIDTGIPSDSGNEWQYTADISCNNEVFARLLIEKIRKHQDETTEAALKAMYETGYKDGKHHKAKKGWFPSNLKFRF